jgi:hypothetical protein
MKNAIVSKSAISGKTEAHPQTALIEKIRHLTIWPLRKSAQVWANEDVLSDAQA